MTQARKRRTAAEARELILGTAERRLGELGLEGLNIVGVAEEAGISHATLIHHFGNTSGMRDALVERMSERLIADIVAALEAGDVQPGQLVSGLFKTLSEGGHARLLAWRFVEGESDKPAPEEIRALFGSLLAACAEKLTIADQTLVQNIVMLVACTAIGLGIAGPVLADLLAMDTADDDAFADWVVHQITHMHG